MNVRTAVAEVDTELQSLPEWCDGDSDDVGWTIHLHADVIDKAAEVAIAAAVCA